jgi:hypoxanthine phosphoribosyltransferase
MTVIGSERVGIALRSVLFSREDLAERIRELGREIAAHYPPDEPLVVLGLLKGSFIFLADLVREIERPLEIDFIVASSYGDATTSSGTLRLLYEPGVSLSGSHVLVVEDIVDSGLTLQRLLPLLSERGPRSLEVCTLLHKRRPDAPPLEVRWVGFECPDAFVVGYGLDHAQGSRHLPYIGVV